MLRLVGSRRAPSGSAARAGEDCAKIVLALRAGEAWAQRALLEQHTAGVERRLTRILGSHADLDDLVQEVFIRAFERIGKLREPHALHAWLEAIATFVAREALRRRKRRSWLVFRPPEEAPEIEMPTASSDDRAALRACYEVLGHLDPDEQIAFTLRFIEGMENAEIATTCGVSLATVGRRLQRAQAEFCQRGQKYEALANWFKEGSRWPLRKI